MKHVLEYRWKRESDWHKKHKHVFDSKDGSIEEQKEKWEGEFGHLVKDREVIVQNDPITSPDPKPGQWVTLAVKFVAHCPTCGMEHK